MLDLRSEKGLSLIELITTLVIFTILTAVVLVKFIDMSEQAKIATCRGNVSAIKAAGQMWYAEQILSGAGDVEYTTSVEELTRYFADNEFPVYPDDGIYQIQAGNEVFCSLNKHRF